jgi:cytochrome c oxidase subunit I+III
MVVLILVASSLYIAYAFSYFYLWTVSPAAWAVSLVSLPHAVWPTATAVLAVAGFWLMRLVARSLPESERRNPLTPFFLALGAILLLTAVLTELFGHLQRGLTPTGSAYGALVYMASVLNIQLVVAVFILLCFALARYLSGKLDRERRVSFENAWLLYGYAVVQILLGLVLVHGFPRAVT